MNYRIRLLALIPSLILILLCMGGLTGYWKLPGEPILFCISEIFCGLILLSIAGLPSASHYLLLPIMLYKTFLSVYFLFILPGILPPVFIVLQHIIPLLFCLWAWIIRVRIQKKKEYFWKEFYENESDIGLEDFITNEGNTLQSIVDNKPTLLVFLRHFGCTFCRETLEEIGAKEKNLSIRGIAIVLIHLDKENRALPVLSHFQVAQLPRVADPETVLYKKFNLRKGNIAALFSPLVVKRLLIDGLLKKYGNTPSEDADYRQMPGVFLCYKDKILASFIHSNVAERPDYEKIAATAGILL